MLRWTKTKVTVPETGGSYDRTGYAAVTWRDMLYCFARGLNKLRHDHDMHVYVFNTVDLRWRELTPVVFPGGSDVPEVPRCHSGHTVVLVEGIVYVWGGCNFNTGEHDNALYAYDVDARTWSKPRVSGAVPEGRRHHSACVSGKVMFIHGGLTQIGRTNDLYKLDTSTLVWTSVNARGTPPPGSECHSATVIGTKMFVFGGYGGYQMGHYNYNTIRVFDPETSHWMDTPSETEPLPEKRGGHSAFTYNGELYIFSDAGYNTQAFNDLWKYSPETCTWKEVKPKGNGPDSTFGMCCCSVGDRIIFFGGYKREPVLDGYDELFILDMSPSLETLCKLAVIQYDLDLSELPRVIRGELAAMMNKTR